MCKVMSSSALICGITSSDTPEKNGVNSTLLCWLTSPVVALVSEDTSVIKYSSVPTLITAFWLFIADTCGLDSTCTSPCDLSSSMKAAKFELMFSIAVNIPPKAEVAVPSTGTRAPGFRLPSFPLMILVLSLELKILPPPVWPNRIELLPFSLSAAQLIPL